MTIPSRSVPAVSASVVFCFLALVAVCLRVWTRFFMLKTQGVEDYFIIFAMLNSIALTILIAEEAKYGMGQHIDDIPGPTLVSCLKAFYGSLSVYYLSLGFTKASMLLQYLRIFPTKGFRIACSVVLGIVIAYSIWTVTSSIFACTPIALFWDKSLKGTCINQDAMWFTNAGINIATDLAIIILPMPVLRKLNLPKPQKRALMIVFALGGFVCLVSILRLHSLIAISNSPDPTYNNPPAAAWSSVESSVGIVCCCLPTLRPLLAPLFPRIFPSGRPSSNSKLGAYADGYGGKSGFGTTGSVGGGQYGRNVVIESANRSRVGRGREKSVDEESSGDDIKLVTVLEQKYEPRISLEEEQGFGRAL